MIRWLATKELERMCEEVTMA